jgi:hypothetical protein
MVKKKPLNIDVRQDAEVLMQSLFRRMELEKSARPGAMSLIFLEKKAILSLLVVKKMPRKFII